jgi:hypothetical protein
MSETEPGALENLVRKAVGVVRSSDTFRLLTQDAANHLDQRGKGRRQSLERVRAELKPHISEVRAQHDLDHALRWADSGMCRQLRLIGLPSCGHRR